MMSSRDLLFGLNVRISGALSAMRASPVGQWLAVRRVDEVGGRVFDAIILISVIPDWWDTPARSRTPQVCIEPF
jgi:hypothetical protein